ncbi:unnamed protein product [Sphagnum jensenii]|uniref:Kinesin motor domain-containing protein n=1 Tax=Sphagnum jensenii TaxID=128206 RepID=A0ABP0WL66_9BRYO
MGKGMSPLRLFTQNSPKKLQQQIPSSSLMSSIEAAAGISGRQPLCPIVEAAPTGSRKSLQAEPCAATNWSSSTPKSKRRVLGLENMQESNVGSNGEAPAGGGIGAGMTPEKHVVIHAGFAQAAGVGASSAVKPKCTWQYKQPASHGLEIPSSSSLRRSPYVPSRSSLSESNAVFPRTDSGCDSRATPSKNPTKNSVGSTTNSGSEAVALRPSGQFQGGSKNAASGGEFAYATPKGTSRMQGKPPIVDAAELRASCSGTLQTLAAATPSRNVTRALRYGMTSVNQNGSTCSVIAGSSLARGAAAGALSSSGGKSVLQTSGMMQQQQPSEHCMEQQQYFELQEDPTFWREHNVQVVIRLRPINSLEASTQGFNRCVKQESAHCISWVGHPESRFTFDHVASEYITQEKLFTVAGLPMVENCMAGYNSCMFCYGQTGSGKTHTMLGDIVDLDHWPSDDRGMTPRVFEHLFAKIHLDEEHRKHENLRYICKCSFLEIYNEQITDLLEPSSTNLQIREDGKKGVYVENLSEVEVESVQDVVHLLLLGAMNRKVAATNLNGESSRSHSVFTCIIQSKWECESVTNTRFGRLNLVDLAGSERQKLSGAEGDRLKEAANINKSLSTLGLVIMILVDVANGKQRHVPYRDSKLTFLLQDSLGGNSKTTMIANISPSSCCALETLSTLKFAQRAKKIKNNAIVNEDASGDVKGLRQEIQELKEELDRCRRKDVFWMPSMWTVGSVQGSLQELDHGLGVATVTVDGVEKARCSFDSQEFGKALSGPHITHKKLKALEGVLAGALRREQAADLTLKQLAAEIEQLNRLVKQREDDSQCSKMMLRFREDKIKRLESVANGFLSADAFLVQEKNALVEELQLVQGRLDRNPELTRFAMENIRLLEQLRRLQEFYTGGEREAMADEISNLRDQELEALKIALEEEWVPHPNVVESLEGQKSFVVNELESLRMEYARTLEQKDEVAAALKREAVAASQNVAHLVQKLENMKLALMAVTKESEEWAMKYEKLAKEKDGELRAAGLQRQWEDSHARQTHLQGEVGAADDEVLEKLERNSAALSIMGWWLCTKAEMQCKSEERMRAELKAASVGELQSRDTLVVSLQRELESSTEPIQEQDSLESELHPQRELALQKEKLDELLLTKERKVVELKELVAEQLGKWEAENETLMVAALEAEHQFLDKDQKLHLTQKHLVTLQAQMTEAEVHERALSSRVEELLVGNEAAVRENENLRLEVSELRVNAERLELELLRLGSVNAERMTALESKLQKAQESVEDAETQMKLMVSEMEASLATEKLESKAESLISGSLLVLQKELAKVLEEKIESEQLAAAEKSELLRDLNRLESENLILKSDIQHLGVELEHAKSLSLEKELEMSAVKEDRHQIETKAKHVQENLETLIDAYTVSESKWEEEKDILTAENRKLASCMAYRDMEFAALQEHKMILERSLHEVSENRGLLQQRLETLEAEWNAEKEKYSDCLAESSKLLSDKEKAMEAMQMELAEAHTSLCASSAKITLLLETNAVRHEEWVAERSQLQSLQEQLQPELTHWEQYAAELHKSCSHVLSPLSENRTIPATNWRSSSKLFDDMKKEVERTRINCEKLHAKLREKDNAILCVQMEFGAVKAKGMQVECDLKNLHQEKEKLRHELAVVNSKLAEAQDEICCRKLQLQAYESELGRVMKMQIEAEQRRDQAELEWRKDREELETEKEAAKLDANEKGSEAATSLQKLETAQATLREAEHLVNALVRANGGAKYEALESKMELEQVVIEANNLLSGLEDEVNVTMGYAEMKMQVLGVELQDTKQVIEEECLKMPIGFHQELEEMLAVILHDYAMEAARVQARLQAVEADFDALQESLKDTLCETKSQETGWAETAAELDILWATVAEKETESSNLQSKLHHSLECISKLEKLYAESQAENENLHSNLKSMDMRIKDSQAQVNEASAQQKVASAQLAAEVEKSRAEIHVLQTSLQEAELVKVEVTEYQQRAVAAETALGDARMEMESLRWELKQKVDVVATLEVDMNVLQEMLIEDLQMEQELELTKAAARGLQEELDIRNNQIAFLEVDLSKKTQELSQLRQQLTSSKSSLCALETELDIKQQTIESLEDELLMVEQSMAHTLEEATGDLRNLETEQDKLHSELLMLRKQLEVAQAVANERDEVAAEARQVAEICRTHAEEKEEEANLLGKSVEELESAVCALENQLSLVKQEAERQQLMREDMEMKIQGLENHVSMMQAALAETVAQSAEELRETKSVQKISDRSHFLSVAAATAAINSSMVRISDLLLTVESQTAEYEQKVKALESVVEELKLENSRNGSLSAKTGSESALKVKGSLSPFTCMGIGLALQMSPQHDAKYFSYRCRIEELEALASSRQKEVFLLNTRLAEAESMTHDVIRDLVGVKKDLTSFTSMLGKQQVQQLAEVAENKTSEVDEKGLELMSLRSQINTFIEERECWLQEIDHRRSETMAACISVEKLRKDNKSLIAENEKIKEENLSHQNCIGELKDEVNKLSGQQNLQQRIHHHTKIKEENLSLRTMNDDLRGKLRRSELLFARVNDELAQYRVSEGKSPFVNIDEEELLRSKLQEAEGSNVQLVQKLRDLCTAILKAAGVSESEQEVDSLSIAMDALQELEARIHSTEHELNDIKIKTKVAQEKRRLQELRGVLSPVKSPNNFTSLQRIRSPSPAPC